MAGLGPSGVRLLPIRYLPYGLYMFEGACLPEYGRSVFIYVFWWKILNVPLGAWEDVSAVYKDLGGEPALE